MANDKKQSIENQEKITHVSATKASKAHEENSTLVHSLVGKTFDRYQIIEKIGQGGMGQVYKVHDSKLNRVVALKLILGDISPKKVERFWREAKAMGQLKHCNIIEIYDLGNFEGDNFFTMDYVEGISFKDFIYQSSSIPTSQLVNLMIQVAKAVHYAHSQGVIHRDLKPANILVDKKNTAKVMDFGLAKLTNHEDNLSRSGDQMGTPAYMAPEQAEGSKVDVRSDVYALGATLYEALTGRAPFQGENYFNIIYQLLNADPISPRTLNPDIPIELEAISLKCLEKKPGQRYENAQKLMEDLQNFRDNRPIKARPATTWVHVRKWMIRHYIAIATVAIIFLTLIIAEARARSGEKKAIIHLAQIVLSKSKEELAAHRWREAGVLAGKALKFLKDYRKDNAALIKQGEALVKFSLHGFGLLWQNNVGKHEAKNIRIEDLAANFKESHLSPEYLPFSKMVAFHPQNKIMATATSSGVRLWDTYTGKLITTLVKNKFFTCAVFYPEGDLLACAAWDGTIATWNVYSWKVVKTVKAHTCGVSSLGFSPNGKMWVSSGWDKNVHLWNVKGEKLHTFTHPEGVGAFAFGPKNKKLVCASNKIIFLWDIESKKKIKHWSGDYIPITSLIFRDEKNLVSASWNYKARLWDMEIYKQKAYFLGHSGV